MRVPHSLDSPGCGVQDDVLACLLLAACLLAAQRCDGALCF
ncbi:hypothetical protein [Xylella fastidiosa]|nr:hypothetical protein [Xylella fastidiosa]